MWIIATVLLIGHVMISIKCYKSAEVNKEYSKRFLTGKMSFITLKILEKFGYKFSYSIDTIIFQKYLNVYREEQARQLHKLYISDKLTIIMLWIEFSLFTYSHLDTMTFLIFTMLFSVFAVSEDIKLNNEIKQKKKSIYIDFPEIINKFVLLIGAGVPIIKAWCMMESDKEGWIYREVNNSVKEFELGKSEKKVFEDFAMRCNSLEISRVMTILIQNSRFGNDDITSILKIQSGECWGIRKTEAKKLAEEASTKMVFSLALMFIGILIIVVTPAVISMGQV